MSFNSQTNGFERGIVCCHKKSFLETKNNIIKKPKSQGKAQETRILRKKFTKIKNHLVCLGGFYNFLESLSSSPRPFSSPHLHHSTTPLPAAKLSLGKAVVRASIEP